VSFPTASIPCNDTPVLDVLSDKDGAHDRTFEIMPAPSNPVLHRYIRNLARVRMDLALIQAGENESSDQAVVVLDAFNHLVPSSPALLGVSAQMHGVVYLRAILNSRGQRRRG
jgi:hypothetical protein